VNCTGSCSWKVYVKDGIITWEAQQDQRNQQQIQHEADAPQPDGGRPKQRRLRRPDRNQGRRRDGEGLRADHPQQPAAVDAAKHRVTLSREQQAGGHAVGQHQPYDSSEASKHRRGQRMTGGRG
jgi:hypothetical protein